MAVPSRFRTMERTSRESSFQRSSGERFSKEMQEIASDKLQTLLDRHSNSVRNPGVSPEHWALNRADRVATSLFEQPTAGFTIWNLRGFWKPYDDFTIIAGVLNFTNKYYREHLDYRSGLGVYQPGSSYYVSTELRY